MRKLILLFSIACLVALALMGILVHGASPGPPSQEIHGLGIGDHLAKSGIVYLSGRRLDCTRVEEIRPSLSVCTVTIAGKTLEIQARRNPPTDPSQLGGTCEALYDGRQWPCSIGSRHVDVPWFAYISEPLGLDEAEMEALRRRFFTENLPEDAFITAIIVVPIVAATVSILAAIAWIWPRLQRKSSYVLLVIGSGAAALAATFTLLLFLTRGFWD